MFQIRYKFRPAAPIAVLLAAAAVIPFCVSCQSENFYHPGPKDPYAGNAPKTKEEEEYYRDVLSGDWKKQNTNMLGYFGLGRNLVSTTPPPHWTMQPPAGAKTMDEIRAEAYDRRLAEQRAGRMRGSDPNAPVYKTAAADMPNRPDTAVRPASAVEPAPKKGEPAKTEEVKEKKKSFFEKWTRFQRKGDEPSLAENESVRASGPGRETVVRGQAPENLAGSRASGGVITTADAVKVPLTVDPDSAGRWPSVSGLIIPDNVPKDLPDDEYIIVGGDAGGEAFALPNWDVHNLESDETIAHFDTLSGQIKVEPSNRFVIYLPRFGTVRQTVGPKSNSQNTRLTAMNQDLAPVETEKAAGTDFRTQQEQVSSARGMTQLSGIGANQPGGEMVSEEGLIEETQKVLTASANSLIREETVTDQSRLVIAQGTAAAAAWGKTQGVAVQIDKVSAQGNVTLQGAATIYSIENNTKTSQLRLFKTASKQQAAPGELIEFVIRYENVGGEVIGNVTILDSLSARLEYVEDSAVSSKKADFLVKNNETGSLVLRLEVTDPLEPGDYGVLSFLCRVR